jgi:7-cyano-7-deazaguanine reductase
MPKRSNQGKPKLKLLGGGPAPFPAEPSPNILETFPNRYPDRKYWIRFDCEDFTSLCPITGQPDFATLEIQYIPGDRCVETKSLKFYLAAFRNVRSFNEEIANRILDDLVKVLAPRRLLVRASFAARGGIALTVDAAYPDEAGSQAGA